MNTIVVMEIGDDDVANEEVKSLFDNLEQWCASQKIAKTNPLQQRPMDLQPLLFAYQFAEFLASQPQPKGMSVKEALESLNRK